MRNLKRMLVGAGLVAGFALTASAATVEGFLMDKMCASAKKDGSAHTRECALMPACIKSGYTVITADGKVLNLDEKGNQEALKVLKATKMTDNLKVTVKGDVTGDSIKVASLKLK